jgi:hypothetical protein
MMEVVKRTWGRPGSDYFIQRGRLDEPRLVRQLKKAQEAGEPVILLGTTIAFLALFDYLEQSNGRLRLHPGSRVMDTGGMKTSKKEITRSVFIDKVGKWLGIQEAACINEYGMCEMGSQFYGRGSNTNLEGPPWVRTLIIDPLTGQEVSPGKQGLLRHFDLANVDSVMAVQTEDMGIAPSSGLRPPLPTSCRGLAGLIGLSTGRPSPEKGEGTAFPSPFPGEGARRAGEGFVLLGRASTAELKGCSLAAERLLR